MLANTVTSAAPGSTCPASGTGGSAVHRHHRRSSPARCRSPPRPAPPWAPAPPGGTIQNSLGTIQVTDGRGFGADWTASVSSTDFTTGGGSPTETIPVGDATYTITGLATATGPATFTNVTTVTLSGTPQAVVNATNVDGQHRRHLGPRDPDRRAGRGRRRDIHRDHHPLRVLTAEPDPAPS